VQDIMAAVGLASLSNLRGDTSMMTMARQKYGLALRQTGRLIQASSMPDFEVTMRSVVMLAMFEVCALTPDAVQYAPMVSTISAFPFSYSMLARYILTPL
jgi:hypothetical protein